MVSAFTRHTCYCHPRGNPKNPYRFFDLHEGKLIKRSGLFICNSCLGRKRKYAFDTAVRRKATPIEVIVCRLLESRNYSFQRNFQLGKFRFDFALPGLHLLVEVDGNTYHKKESPSPDGLPKKMRYGTKRWVADQAGWKMVRIQNGPYFKKRFWQEIESVIKHSCVPTSNGLDCGCLS